MARRFSKEQVQALRTADQREADYLATWKRGAAVQQVEGGWDDLQTPITDSVGGAALTTVAYRGTAARIATFSSAGTDLVTLWIQMPHRWDPLTAVKPHVHWIPLGLPGGARVVLFEYSYRWVAPNEVLPDVGSWTTGSVTENITVTDQYIHKITPLVTVPAPAAGVASHFLALTVRRNGASAVDTYTDGGPSNVGLLSIDTHYQSRRTGTYTEY